MPDENKQRGFAKLLASDQRIATPDVQNDHVWEMGIGTNSPRALSLSTSYGLRARRMHLFPRFSLGDTKLTNPDDFHSFPLLQFTSTNFVTLAFYPFPYLDVLSRVWVPDSQTICGQLSFTNEGEKTVSFGVDWLCLLNPFPGGNPMKQVQMGMNKVLQGETAGVYPVFYMTGGPEEANSPFPGLGIHLVLSPGVSRQVTWVLASRDSIKTSFSHARHYSSKLLENEQLSMEMRDRNDWVGIHPEDSFQEQKLQESQVQACQLLMPPVNKFTCPAYVTDRTPDTGNNPRLEILETSPGWSGQTLMDTWMMMDNVVPGNPELIKGFLENHLQTQDEYGKVDLQANCNMRSSGLLAPPLLNTITCEIQSYLNDQEWLRSNLPRLEEFLNHWIRFEVDKVEPQITGWAHPLQTGIELSSQLDENGRLDYFPALNSSGDILLLSLLYREIESYIQLSKLAGSTRDTRKYEEALPFLKTKAIDQFQVSITASITPNPDNQMAGTFISFIQDGKSPLHAVFPTPSRISLHMVANQLLTGDFCCTLTGKGTNGKVIEEIRPQSFIWAGNIGFYTSLNTFQTITSMHLKGWSAENSGWMEPEGVRPDEITQFMPLWAGIPALDAVDKLLDTRVIDRFLGPEGLTFTPSASGKSARKVPGFLAVMIIEGLLRYGKTGEARSVYERHFLNPISNCSPGSIRNLLPVNLYLKILGVRKITTNEIILTHFLNNPESITVQYGKVRLLLEQGHADIDLGSSGQFTVNSPGPHRILLA